MSNEQRAVRLYWRLDNGLIWVPRDDGGEETATPGQCARIANQLVEQRDALSTELAEAKAEIERMREALPLLRDSRSSFTSLASADGEDMGEWGAQLARQSYEAIDSYLAALIPAKGKGER